MNVRSFLAEDLACLGISLRQAGTASGKLAGRVIRGTNPKEIPLGEVAVEQVGLSRSNADRLGITIPAEYMNYVQP